MIMKYSGTHYQGGGDGFVFNTNEHNCEDCGGMSVIVYVRVDNSTEGPKLSFRTWCVVCGMWSNRRISWTCAKEEANDRD